MSTSLGWEGNHRSVIITPAMCRRQQWFIHLRAQRPVREIFSTLPELHARNDDYAPSEYGPPLPLSFYDCCTSHCQFSCIFTAICKGCWLPDIPISGEIHSLRTRSFSRPTYTATCSMLPN